MAETEHVTPLILLPGMAADELLFGSQLAAFPALSVPPWIDPLPGESLCEYAKRLAKIFDPGRSCVVGGASFGGIVALEIAQYLPTKTCILIGSVRSPAELPWRWRVLCPFAHFGPDVLGRVAGMLARFARLLPRATSRRMRKLARPEAAFVRWALCAVLRWRPSPATKRVRVFHIHGESDRTLPVGLTHPDVVVPGGAHALSLFSPGEVNEFIRKVLEWASEDRHPNLTPSLQT